MVMWIDCDATMWHEEENGVKRIYLIPNKAVYVAIYFITQLVLYTKHKLYIISSTLKLNRELVTFLIMKFKYANNFILRYIYKKYVQSQYNQLNKQKNADTQTQTPEGRACKIRVQNSLFSIRAPRRCFHCSALLLRLMMMAVLCSMSTKSTYINRRR